ncbi:MAG: hypothetical protein IE931_10670 [Sphingobacteriales bacterium]|nr:hypothetical protein [Sphingobacteriales bacterium]
MKAHQGMRPHDIVVLLKIISLNKDWMNKDLASELFISNSEISESLNRSMIARLISPDKKKVFKKALLNFIENGLGYVFPIEPGQMGRGILTAHSAPILKDYFASNEVYVWGTPDGDARGQMIAPLYPNQIKAVKIDPKLYNMLALVDAVRLGKPREQTKAIELLNLIFDGQYA